MKTNYALIVFLFIGLTKVVAQEKANLLQENELVGATVSISYVDAFPNPTQDFIRIHLNETFREVRIKAKTQELYVLKADNNIVDVSTLPKGIYTLRVDTLNGIYYSKLYKR